MNFNSPSGQGSDSKTPSGWPATKSVSSRPNGASPEQGNGTSRPITPWALLDAFRRRWLPAIAVAIPAAILISALVGNSVPGEYESSALLKVRQFENHLVFKKELADEFNHYVKSQINFLQSRVVLTAAMNVEGVRECRLMAGKSYPVEWLQENMEVESDYSDEFIRITLAGEYPEDLALVINAVKDVYLDQVVFNEKNKKNQDLRLLEETFRERNETVRKNQDRIARLAEELGTGDPKVAVVAMGLLQERLQGLQADLRKIMSDIREEEALRQYLMERGLSPDQIPSRIPGFSSVGAAAAVAGAENQQTKLKQALLFVQGQIRRFKANIRNPSHPDLIALKNREAELRELLADAPTGERKQGIGMSRYEWLNKQRIKLEDELQQTQEQLDIKGARIVELENQKKDIQYLVENRDKLAEQIAASEVELRAQSRVELLQEANVPQKRDISRKVQLSIMSGIGVFALVIGGFTMFEWFTHRVGSTSDIANAVNLRLVGTIPSPDKGGLLGLGIFAGKVDYDEWNRAVIESMDVVRTYLMRHIDPSRSASILITSASANEGKTTVSCQLAASLARAGKRVALVDCDFRRPSAHLLLEGDAGPGISEYLRGEVSLGEIQQATQADRLTFIPAGTVDQSVLQTLSADGGRSIIDTLKAEFDFVIIDTSPLLFVAEPSMLAQNADIVLLATRKDYSRIPYVAQSRDSLRSLQVPLLGAVMVGSDSDFQRQTYGYRQEIKQRTGLQQKVPV